MAQNFWLTIVAWTVCFLVTIGVSLLTRREKSDRETQTCGEGTFLISRLNTGSKKEPGGFGNKSVADPTTISIVRRCRPAGPSCSSWSAEMLVPPNPPRRWPKLLPIHEKNAGNEPWVPSGGDLSPRGLKSRKICSLDGLTRGPTGFLRYKRCHGTSWIRSTTCWSKIFLNSEGTKKQAQSFQSECSDDPGRGNTSMPRRSLRRCPECR